jgi:hypothetical protein
MKIKRKSISVIKYLEKKLKKYNKLLENVKDRYFMLENKWYPPDGTNPSPVNMYEDDAYIEYLSITKYLNKIIKKLKKKKEG